MANITKMQISKIWATVKELGWDKDLLYCAVNRISGGDSISELSKQQAIQLIEYLLSHKKTVKETRPGMATEKQLRLINKLVGNLGWDDDPKRLQSFIKKYSKVDSPKWMTVKMASNIIQALKAIIARQTAESEAQKVVTEG
jgi:ArsR family metal-binding transcriptional regulator